MLFSESAREVANVIDDLSCGDLLGYEGIEYCYLTQEEETSISRLRE
jgi:hypothetical protein